MMPMVRMLPAVLALLAVAASAAAQAPARTQSTAPVRVQAPAPVKAPVKAPATAPAKAPISSPVKATRASPETAPEPPVITALRGQQVTIFDAGLKRLRRFAIEAADRLASAVDPRPLVRVAYETRTGTIEIEFRFVAAADDARTLSQAGCQLKRKTAIRETFNVGRIIYAAPISVEEQIRRRLGTQFVVEPVSGPKETIAMGQALARITYLSATIAAGDPARTVTCRDTVAPETGSR